MLLCLLGGGIVAGRLTGRMKAGLYAGLVASILNLLILGSLLAGSEPNAVIPSALIWVPGSLLAGAVVGALGGAFGSRRATSPAPRNWTASFALVGVIATFLLLIAGGIVTGSESGLAVVDWPNSFGYNMFLYPLAKMSGGIFYEHAHRLLGSLVGLTTLVLAIHLARFEKRRSVKQLAFTILLLVIVQGILGGLRVTGKPTLSTSPEVMEPSLLLAAVHGVTGQIFFGLFVALAIFLSTPWIKNTLGEKRSAPTDRGLATAFVILLVAQITLGAVQRHFAGGLWLHISLAVVVLGVGVAGGARAWGLYEDTPTVGRTGQAVLLVLIVQMVLGVVSLAATGIHPSGGMPSAFDVTATTIHQAVGAVLLALAVGLLLWLRQASGSGKE